MSDDPASSGQEGCKSGVPEAVLAAAEQMLAAVPDPLQLGDHRVVDGYCLETHTLGCRNHADEPEPEWWDSHWAIYDEYATDGLSVIVGDPADGRFATITPQRAG